MTTKCGYIAFLGLPNAGKSTLLNALLGQKLAVVSRKPQTTRNRILGVHCEDETQMLFLDTPGVHKTRGNTLLNATMNKVALRTAGEADLILYLIDAGTGLTDADTATLRRIAKVANAPITIALSKIDRIKLFEVKKLIGKVADQLRTLRASDETLATKIPMQIPLTVTAKRPESHNALLQWIKPQMPDGPWLFGADDLTDVSENFVLAELIREQLFRRLGQELPYGCAVKIQALEKKPNIVVVMAQIVVSRAHHKSLVLGKQGQKIKEIGQHARESLEEHFGSKVFLDLHVSTESNWTDRQDSVSDLGYFDLDQL